LRKHLQCHVSSTAFPCSFDGCKKSYNRVLVVGALLLPPLIYRLFVALICCLFAVTEEQRGLLPHFTATADADDEQDVPDGELYDAEWLQAFVLLDTARAYHTATYLGPDSGAHASNADSIW
jgi:hypothetical protein